MPQQVMSKTDAGKLRRLGLPRMNQVQRPLFLDFILADWSLGRSSGLSAERKRFRIG
jgi:hypothetical protein